MEKIDRLTQLLKLEAKLRVDLLDPKVTQLELPNGFHPQQIGLREVMCSADGRLWDTRANPIKVIFDPKWAARSAILTGTDL